MSTKHFCDQCGDELTDDNSVGGVRLKGWLGKLQFEIMVGPTGGALNDGEWCAYCIFDAVALCDDRAEPRPVEVMNDTTRLRKMAEAVPRGAAFNIKDMRCMMALTTFQAGSDPAVILGLLDAIDRLTAERDALRAFAIAILAEWPDSCVDGFDIQDLAIKHGLLKLKDPAPTESCGDGCACAEYFGEADWAGGVECYRRSELLTGEKP